MYAVIETGGKQYRVEVGMELEVESLDVELGKTVTIDRVILVADGDDASIGRPVVDGAAVSAEVVRQTRGDARGPVLQEKAPRPAEARSGIVRRAPLERQFALASRRSGLRGTG